MSDIQPEIEMQWPPAGGVLVQYLYSVANKVPGVDPSSLSALAQDKRLAEGDDAFDGGQAVALVSHVVNTWLKTVLETTDDDATIKGLRSLPTTEPEDLDGVAISVRENYVRDLQEGPLRRAAEHIAAACEAAAELRVFEYRSAPPEPGDGQHGGTPRAQPHRSDKGAIDNIVSSLTDALCEARDAGVVSDPGEAASVAVQAALDTRPRVF